MADDAAAGREFALPLSRGWARPRSAASAQASAWESVALSALVGAAFGLYAGSLPGGVAVFLLALAIETALRRSAHAHADGWQPHTWTHAAYQI